MFALFWIDPNIHGVILKLQNMLSLFKLFLIAFDEGERNPIQFSSSGKIEDYAISLP